MAHEDDVDAGNFLRDRDRLVLVWNLSGVHFTRAKIFLETHVHGDDNHVNTFLLAQNRNPLAGFDERLMKFETGIVRRIVPVRHAGRGETKNSDFYTANFLDDVRFVMRFLGCSVVCVGREPGKVCFAARLF